MGTRAAAAPIPRFVPVSHPGTNTQVRTSRGTGTAPAAIRFRLIMADRAGSKFSVVIPPNRITKLLTADHEDLESFGVRFTYKRKNSGRYLIFQKTEGFLSPEARPDKDELFGSLLRRGEGDGSGGVTADSRCENSCHAVTLPPSSDATPPESGIFTSSDIGAG